MQERRPRRRGLRSKRRNKRRLFSLLGMMEEIRRHKRNRDPERKLLEEHERLLRSLRMFQETLVRWPGPSTQRQFLRTIPRRQWAQGNPRPRRGQLMNPERPRPRG